MQHFTSDNTEGFTEQELVHANTIVVNIGILKERVRELEQELVESRAEWEIETRRGQRHRARLMVAEKRVDELEKYVCELETKAAAEHLAAQHRNEHVAELEQELVEERAREQSQ